MGGALTLEGVQMRGRRYYRYPKVHDINVWDKAKAFFIFKVYGGGELGYGLSGRITKGVLRK